MRNTLIRNVKEIIKEPYSDYAIGTTDNGNKFNKTSGTGGIVVCNARNDADTLVAYVYFTEHGMTALKPIGERAKYIYFYRLDGQQISII